MIKDAIKYVVGLAAPTVQEINGEQYSDKELNRVQRDLRAKSIEMSTLGSLVEYIKSGTDTFKGKLLVHVVAPDTVELTSQLDGDRCRETLVTVKANLPRIRLDTYLGQEEFIIMMQSQFVNNEGREDVMAVSGNVVDQTVANYGDDGVSQRATISTGVASKDAIIIPNPVELLPYRTFQEIQQIPTNFIFRMKNGAGVQMALFEADGGAWKIEAVQAVAEYLRQNLQDEYDILTVIA